MASYVITPEMQRENAEALVGADPRKFRDPGVRWTARKRTEMERMLKLNGGDKPVTVLNLNPFPLSINGGVFFPYVIPACKPGEDYAVYVIREARWGHVDRGCDLQNMMQFEPVAVMAMEQAAEFIREYSQQDGGFGGVLCYIGDRAPETMKAEEQIRVPLVAYNANGESYVDVQERPFGQQMAAVRQKRNASVLQRLQSANSWYENDDQRMNVNDLHRDLARLALAEGLIPELPRWVMQANMLLQKQPDPCPLCRTIPKFGSIVCTNCSHVYDVVEAYRNARIAYGAVEMDRLDEKGWADVEAIKAERDAAKAKGQKKAGPGK